jgi:hypothetical protein
MDLVALAWQSEEDLLTPAVRNDPRRVAELLAPGFYEIGQSGRRWSRDETLAQLTAPSDPLPAAVLSEREAQLLGPDLVLLSYHLALGTRMSRRSSLWRRGAHGMECLFHQGTPLPL